MLIVNVKHLAECWKDRKLDYIVNFGKHKGKKLKDVPNGYIEWAVAETEGKTRPTPRPIPSAPPDFDLEEFYKTLEKFFDVQPSILHNLFVKATSESTGVEIAPFYHEMCEDDKKIWTKYGTIIKEYFIYKIKGLDIK